MSLPERNYQAERQQREREREEEHANVTKFHNFLQGDIPEEVTVRKIKKMNPEQAMAVIWFLQECCHLLDDRFEMCHVCKVIYDSHSEGSYDEKAGHNYCGSCDPRDC